MTRLVRALAVIVLALNLHAPAKAQSFEDAASAYAHGDYATALRVYSVAAEQGNGPAQYILGWMYDHGEGVPQDYVAAAKWYRMAALQKEVLVTADGKDIRAEAQYQLGFLYFQGHGVQQNFTEALKWFRTAAEAGEADAELWLGIVLRSDGGKADDFRICPKCPADDAAALKWLRKAADQGVPEARSNLGFMYENGEGVPQDYVKAHMWFNLAAAVAKPKDREMMARYRDDLAGKMTPAQVAEAQRLAREYVPQR